MISLPIMQATRFAKCRKCKYYLPSETDQTLGKCDYLIKHTRRKGLLDHPSHGISNPRSRCPYYKDRQWSELQSYHTWYFLRHIIAPEIVSKHIYPSRDETYLRYMLTKNGITIRNSITWATILHESLPESPLRSTMYQAIEELRQQPNGYQHIDGAIKIDYVSGQTYIDPDLLKR